MNKFEFHALTEKDIEKIVKHIPSNKAPGHDRVSARMLKDSLPATLPVITNLINSSFASNCFAQAWKLAEVIPNLKSGDPDEPETTRPISLLPIMSKVCERAAHSQFLDFLDKNSKISGLQSGNRKLHSTETALVHYTDQLLNVYRLLCCLICPKHSTASGMTNFYRSYNHWVCLIPL